jgi:lipopolysaccharide biosynthesis regulator YciM
MPDPLHRRGSDELSMTAPKAMLDTSRAAPILNNQEIFEIQYSLVQMYRRRREFSRAEELVKPLIASSETVHSKNHAYPRLAFSQYVYIMNDQNRYVEALGIAEDVLVRAQLQLGNAYPDDSVVYAMEDLAEICDNLEMMNDTIEWLRKASRAALSIWGNQPSTLHILDKLEAMHDKEISTSYAIGHITSSTTIYSTNPMKLLIKKKGMDRLYSLLSPICTQFIWDSSRLWAKEKSF